MGSSWSSSPLKSVIMLFQSEPSDSREDMLARGNGALDEAVAITRLRSTSLTLILRRLFRFAAIVLDLTVSCVTVPVGDGVRVRGLMTTIEWSTVSSISVSESVSCSSGLMAGKGFCKSIDDEGLVKTSASLLLPVSLCSFGSGGTGGGNASNTAGAVNGALGEDVTVLWKHRSAREST
jgi:hypothetical protein